MFFFFLLFSREEVIHITDSGWIRSIILNPKNDLYLFFEKTNGLIIINFVESVSVLYQVGENGFKSLTTPNGKSFFFGVNQGEFVFKLLSSGTPYINIKATIIPSKCTYLKISNSPSGIWRGSAPTNVKKCLGLFAPSYLNDWKIDLTTNTSKPGKFNLISSSIERDSSTYWIGTNIIEYTPSKTIETFSVTWSVSQIDLTYPIIYGQISNIDEEAGLVTNDTWSTLDSNVYIAPTWPLAVFIAVWVLLTIVFTILYCFWRYKWIYEQRTTVVKADEGIPVNNDQKSLPNENQEETKPKINNNDALFTPDQFIAVQGGNIILGNTSGVSPISIPSSLPSIYPESVSTIDNESYVYGAPPVDQDGIPVTPPNMSTYLGYRVPFSPGFSQNQQNSDNASSDSITYQQSISSVKVEPVENENSLSSSKNHEDSNTDEERNQNVNDVL